MREDTSVPAPPVLFLLMAVKALAPLSTGASLTAATLMVGEVVALLKAVVPPLVLVLAMLPGVPVLRSQARRVMLLVPFQSALGVKRMTVVASAASSRADESVGEPKACQVVPSSVYCQVPWLLSTAVTAMPVSAPLSTSVV